MLLIAHRGNIEGPNPVFENHPNELMFIFENLEFLHVEIDMWWHENAFWLGHDRPLYPFEEYFWTYKDRLWIHAKTPETGYRLAMQGKGLNYFFHDKDEVVLTSWGYMWTYPGGRLTRQSIRVMPELEPNQPVDIQTPMVTGICTDHPLKYRTLLGW